eukprot:Opistho-2@46721
MCLHLCGLLYVCVYVCVCVLVCVCVREGGEWRETSLNIWHTVCVLSVTCWLLLCGSPLHGEGATVRNYLYISDAVSAFLRILVDGVDGEAYNIGCDVSMTTLDVARSVVCHVKGEAADPSTWVEYVDDRPLNDHSYPMDFSKVAALGWRPSVTWEDGLARTVLWYRTHPNHWVGLD